ncbi:hypothetical protein QTP88_004374 [Uroleucon formosanum]
MDLTTVTRIPLPIFLLFFALLHLSSYIVRPPVNTLITDLFDLWSPPYSWRVTNSIDYQLSGNDSLAFSRRKLFAVRFKSVTIVIIDLFIILFLIVMIGVWVCHFGKNDLLLLIAKLRPTELYFNQAGGVRGKKAAS